MPRADLIGFAVGGVETDLARFLVNVGVAGTFSLFMTGVYTDRGGWMRWCRDGRVSVAIVYIRFKESKQ